MKNTSMLALEQTYKDDFKKKNSKLFTSKDEIADLEDEYREKVKLLKIEADNHLDKEITKYKEKLAKEQNQKADSEKQKHKLNLIKKSNI